MKDANVEKHKSQKQIMNITSFDNYPLECQLVMPEGEDEVSKLVIYVHGSGPGTYENRDLYEGTDVNMFDTLSDEFSKRGVAFLFLWGYANVNLKDTMIWQLSGESFINLFQDNFEMDDSGRISRIAFDNGQKVMVVTGLGLVDNAFEICYTNTNGYIDKMEITALGKSLIGVDSNKVGMGQVFIIRNSFCGEHP